MAGNLAGPLRDSLTRDPGAVTPPIAA